MKQKGFTLLELVFVILVTVVFSALILPVFSRAGDRNKAALCLENLRAIGVAHNLYTGDWGGYFVPSNARALEPGTENWYNAWYVYFVHAQYLPGRRDDVWYCPSRPRAWYDRLSYGYNATVLGSSHAYTFGDNTPARKDQITRPSQTLLTADSRRWLDTIAGWWDVGSYMVFPYGGYGQTHKPSANHDENSMNIGYVDGSADTVIVPGYDESTDSGRDAPYSVLGEFWAATNQPRKDTPGNHWKR